jgi:selenocysteine-specific translation elongation factor
VDTERTVVEASARKWAIEHRYRLLFVSAKSGEGIEELKSEMIDQYLKKKTGNREINRINLGLPLKNERPCC